MTVTNPIGYSRAEVNAGLFLTSCLALLICFLFVYGKFARYFKGQQEITVVFNSVTSLRHDAPVRFNGYEVGRVKEISILNLRDKAIDKLPAIKVEDLDDLPLTEKEQKDLRGSQAEQFNGDLKKALLNRTMIRLVLEVTNDPREPRYRVDDEIRISTTLMGDTAVEISSGSGDFLKPESPFILGHSGDFFTNLAKSVEQVKEILGSVSDVVGAEERESVRRSLRRFDAITERIEKIVKLADGRLPQTWDRVDGLADSAKQNLTRIGETVSTLQPQVTKTLATADETIKDLQGKIGGLADEARNAVVEIKGETKPIFADLQHITSKTKDDIPLMIKNAKDLAGRLQESAGKLDGVLATGDRLLQESYPDLRRLILAFRMGAENFEEATNLLKRKPWLIYKGATEEPAMNVAQKTARDLEVATRRFAELSTELQAIRRNSLDQVPKERLQNLDFIIQELNVLSGTLKDAGEVTRQAVLPPFERKKTSFVPVVEEFDTNLKKKKEQ